MKITNHLQKFTYLSLSLLISLITLSPEGKAQNSPEYSKCINDCRNDPQKCTGSVMQKGKTEALIEDYCTKNVTEKFKNTLM